MEEKRGLHRGRANRLKGEKEETETHWCETNEPQSSHRLLLKSCVTSTGHQGGVSLAALRSAFTHRPHSLITIIVVVQMFSLLFQSTSQKVSLAGPELQSEQNTDTGKGIMMDVTNSFHPAGGQRRSVSHVFVRIKKRKAPNGKLSKMRCINLTEPDNLTLMLLFTFDS